MKRIKKMVLSKKGKTLILSAILIIAGLSYLYYWWTREEVSTQNKVVDVWGLDPFTIGFQYGRLCKREIQGICSKLGFVGGLFNLIANIQTIHLTIINQPYIPQEFLIEMAGVALGAEVTYNQIFFLNMLPDYIELVSKTAMHCSQFILVNNTNPFVGPMFGRTLDYAGDLVLDRYQVIIRWHAYSNQEHTIIGHTIAGMIGYLTGINEEGLTIGVSQISPWMVGPGISCILAIRDVLQHNTSTEQAVDTFGKYRYKMMGAWCFAILDQNDSAAIMEMYHLNVHTIWHKDVPLPFLAVTNHFLSPNMTGQASYSLQSEARFQALLNLLPLNPAHDLASAISILRSHYNSFYDCYFADQHTICNHGIAPIIGTMGGFIGNPKNRLAVFCLGSPCRSDFYIITFDPINYLIGPVA
ncbi:MAG: C45 family autoproteolytic acyltransferase/hydrolase [Candidatus Helarchaeota archaeon]